MHLNVWPRSRQPRHFTTDVGTVWLIWYVRERKQSSTCSDLAGNLKEIWNITHVRRLVTLFIESPSYKHVLRSAHTDAGANPTRFVVTTAGYESTHTAAAQSPLDGVTAASFSQFAACSVFARPALILTMATELLVECVRKHLWGAVYKCDDRLKHSR
jgi:hypothetical protein